MPPSVSPAAKGQGSPRARLAFTLVLLLWWFGGYGLVAYGAVTDRGPFAFLTDWQVALFGGSNMLVGAGIGALLIFLLPGRLLAWWRRCAPESAWAAFLDTNMRAATRSRRELAADAQIRWAAMDAAQRQAVLRRQRGVMLVLACALLAATWAVAAYVRITANADAGRPLPLLRADAAPGTGGGSKWVRVVGAAPDTDAVMERDYTIRGHAYRDYYTPLLAQGWQRGDRVDLVEKDETMPAYHDRWDAPDPPGPIEGRLAAGGPRPDIAALFRRHGYAVGEWTAVLTRKPLHGVIPGEAEGMGWFIWFMGGVFAALFVLVAATAQIRLIRLARAARGEGSPQA